MQQALRRSNLVRAEFVVESAFFETDKAVFTVRRTIGFGLVPRAELSRAAFTVITAAA